MPGALRASRTSPVVSDPGRLGQANSWSAGARGVSNCTLDARWDPPPTIEPRRNCRRAFGRNPADVPAPAGLTESRDARRVTVPWDLEHQHRDHAVCRCARPHAPANSQRGRFPRRACTSRQASCRYPGRAGACGTTTVRGLASLASRLTPDSGLYSTARLGFGPESRCIASGLRRTALTVSATANRPAAPSTAHCAHGWICALPLGRVRPK